jgi:hypothetical protein
VEYKAPSLLERERDVSKYQYSGKSGLTDLIFADDDAEAFARTLYNIGWSESHIKLLTNENATHFVLLEARKGKRENV